MERQVSKALLQLCLLTLSLLVSTLHASAADNYKTYHALLIGASGYLPPQSATGEAGAPASADIKLLGPPNDVQAVYRTLVALSKSDKPLFDPRNITVVADKLPDEFRRQIEAAGSVVIDRPSHANIVQAFDQLIARASDGDFAYIHLAGHGLQVPALGAALDLEPDGLDEVFAPVDFGPVRQTDNGIVIDNVISDNDIAGTVAALHERGTFVWLVADICHAGDTLRAGWTERAIPPQVLGPDFENAVTKVRNEHARLLVADSTPAIKAPLHEAAAKTGNAGFVAFYAAQSDQTAVEANLPDENSPVSGLLTFALIKALNTAPADVSYGVIAERVRAEYDRHGSDLRQPLFEGELKKLVLGSTSERPAWVAARHSDEIVLRAGALQNAIDDDLVALYPLGLQAQGDKLLTYAVITGATLAEARLRPIASNGRVAAAISELPDTMSVVRLPQRGKLKLRVGLPPQEDLTKLDAITSATVTETLDSVRSSAGENGLGYEVEFVDHGEAADLGLRLRPDRICLTPPNASCERYDDYGRQRPSPAIELSANKLASAIADELKDAFFRVAQVHRLFELYRVASSSSGQDGEDEMLDLQVGIARYPLAEERAAEGEEHICQDFDFEKETPTLLQSDGESGTDALDGLATAVHCDMLTISGLNLGDGPIDVTALYIDSSFEISALPHDSGSDVTVRVPANGRFGGRRYALQAITMCGTCDVKQAPAGTEYILVIAAAPPPENAQYQFDFRNFAQKGLPVVRAADASVACEGEEVTRRLCELEREVQTEVREAAPPPPTKIRMWLYRVNVQPPPPPPQLAGAQ